MIMVDGVMIFEVFRVLATAGWRGPNVLVRSSGKSNVAATPGYYVRQFTWYPGW